MCHGRRDYCTCPVLCVRHPEICVQVLVPACVAFKWLHPPLLHPQTEADSAVCLQASHPGSFVHGNYSRTADWLYIHIRPELAFKHAVASTPLKYEHSRRAARPAAQLPSCSAPGTVQMSPGQHAAARHPPTARSGRGLLPGSVEEGSLPLDGRPWSHRTSPASPTSTSSRTRTANLS